MTKLAGKREIVSIMLGLLTPYWFLFGVDYIFPEMLEQSGLFASSIIYVASVVPTKLSLLNVSLAFLELLVLIPYVVIFSCSAVPGKPLLRKRLQFFAWMNLYLTALMFLYSQDFLLYYIWSLPSLAVMLAYVFSLNVTRFSRFYFIVVNVILLAIVPFCLWLNRL